MQVLKNNCGIQLRKELTRMQRFVDSYNVFCSIESWTMFIIMHTEHKHGADLRGLPIWNICLF